MHILLLAAYTNCAARVSKLSTAWKKDCISLYSCVDRLITVVPSTASAMEMMLSLRINTLKCLSSVIVVIWIKPFIAFVFCTEI